MISGLDAPGRVRDFDLTTADGPARLAELLRSGRGLLLDLHDREWPAGWAGRVDVMHAKADEDFDALLCRPDGRVCWSGDGPVTDALTSWFGGAV
ncbi:hypothetical protein [Amycolatopsis sp.]|uniref:aromatic-ring hydroxylase C-terminal domain-containing protein n=1 Tax=Amycolatopsis sp. TaxID=37632 RepID=UPI002CF4291F|nr:hypothetical protein [Amycolatopsis sp.]HVV11534.1 hypothetical protein [Amycolatopsis sp.]